jgi:hypothetical protein
MKKLIPFIIVGVLLLSGLGAVAVSKTEQKPLEKTETISFSPPVIQDQGQYSLVTVQNTNSWLRRSGAPLLPASVTTYIFPFGTTIRDVAVTFSDSQEYMLEKKIVPVPSPVTFVAGTKITTNQDDIKVGSVYPEKSFEYQLGAGVSNGEHVIFLTVRCYPIQYKPAENTILSSKNADITVSYELPQTQPTVVDEYSLVIIAPKEFARALKPLVNHKTSNGVTTKLVTLDEICSNASNEGRDCAEKVKYFIKNAYDEWGTNYVLLVGGRYGGVMNEKWWVPVRYSHLDDGAQWEGSYLSDLYFADLYDAHGNFSDWDSNGNGIFAEWNTNGKDIIDMYPEVSVGRLPCKNIFEVRTLVNKIITYEATTAGKDWFKKVVLVGGDSAPMVGDPYYEGEEENKLALEYLGAGFEGVKLWTSNGNFTGPQDVIDGISGGCGFLFFDGHGNPMSWSTHPPNNESIWIDGLSVKDMPNLKNGDQLPICVCGGCHNGQFNVSLLNILKGLLTERLKYFQWTFFLGEWTPECWAWRLMSVKNGGSIATMAYTGLDWFAEGDYNNDTIPDCVQYLSGYANTQFFKNYGVYNMTILGQAHTQALIDYLNAFPPMQDKLDCKTVQEFALLGDPSLQIGGYS